MLKKFCNWVKRLINWHKPKKTHHKSPEFCWFDDELLTMAEEQVKALQLPITPPKGEGKKIEFRPYTPLSRGENKVQEDNEDA